MTVAEVYETTIKPMPVADRLRLATMILGDIPVESFIDDQPEWSAQDLADLSVTSLERT